VKKNLLFALLLFSFLISPVNSFANRLISSPPSTIHLKMPEPETKEEAIKRIPDFVVLNIILPPVIDREKLKEELFGNYKNYINKLIKEKKLDIKKLATIAIKEMKGKNFSLPELKRKLLSSISVSLYSANPEETSTITIAIAISIAVLISLLSASFVVRHE
jgi:hypothetical protein